MAKTFKSLLGDDIVSTRTLLHEAIPITGTIASGTYDDNNIKTFSHGMFDSVYDYPYLSSSANQIFDVTFGISSNASRSADYVGGTQYTQQAKKLNIYNQMAQVLMGYDVSGSIRKFDSDGTLDDEEGTMDHCFFINFSRLLSKDEIKKDSFRMALYTTGSCESRGFSSVATSNHTALLTLGDYDAGNEFRTSPAGDYGLIFSASGDSTTNSRSVGLLFYQAGIAVLTSSLFVNSAVGYDRAKFGSTFGAAAGTGEFGQPGAGGDTGTDLRTSPAAAGNHKYYNMLRAQVTGTIDTLANGFRNRIHNIDFNNTIELNSTIYFCRVNHNEFNYSSSPTYVSGSKLVVKNNVSDLPITYITTVGLYSPDNELLAVAKLSEPIRKDPNTELTLRVRLDY